MAKKKTRSEANHDKQIDNLFEANIPDERIGSWDDEIGATVGFAEVESEVESVSAVSLPPIGGATDIFETASGDGRPQFPKLPDLKRGFQEIVSDLFAEGYDVVDEYKTIRDSLSIKGALTPRAIQTASNKAEEMADRAYRLYCVALNEYKAYVREIEALEAIMRDGATTSLEEQKTNKTRTKQITEADILAETYQLYPDTWRDVQARRDNAQAMLDYLGNLSALAKSHCFTISKMQRD